MSTVAKSAFVTVALVVLAAEAGAADQLLRGKKLMVKAGASRQSLSVVLLDDAIVAPGSADAPTAQGATLRIVNPTSGETASFALPASNWTANAPNTVFTFRNTSAPLGVSEAKVARIAGGRRITLRARDTGITLDEPSQGSIGVVLESGSQRYCALFGDAVRRDEPGVFVAKDAPAPDECPGDLRDGVSTDVLLASNVDGEAIAFTVHEPTAVMSGARYPLILEGHGYGGNRVAAAERPAAGDPSLVARLLDSGYAVISIDQRGHGDSGGQIRILDPDFEGKDLIQLLDWAEANLPYLAYRDANLVLGAIGGSYGGGYQHTIYAHDPQHRLDAIAPEITWHDLRYSLFSGMVFKSFWAVTLSAAGNLTPGGQHQQVNDGLANGLTNNSLTQTEQDLLKKVSLVDACEAGTLQPIDALYWQSASDTLFNLNDAVRNFQCLDALGGDVRLLTKNGGHDTVIGGADGDQCGALHKAQAILDWYDEKLKGVAGQASYIPQLCFHIDGSAADGVVPASLPIGGQNATVPPTLITAQDTSPQVVSVPLATIGAGGAVLAGVPTIQLTVSDPLGLELGDPILFLGLARRPSGSSTDTLLQPNQVRPFRGYGAFADELIGLTARLAEGDEVRLLMHASYVARYAGSGSDAAAPVSVEAVIGLPLLPGNLPAPPAN